MFRRLLTPVFMIGILATAGTSIAGQQPAPAPTFAKDVAPILHANCVSCHREGDIAPMSLITYEQSRPWARAIKNKVVSREMPPWNASHASTLKFKNERTLTDAQIQTLVRWADNGAPRGDAADLPPAPKFDSVQWHHPSGRPPDVIVTMAVPAKVQADGEMPIDQYYAKLPFDKDTIIEAAEFQPGNRAVVHHITSSVYVLPADTKFDAEMRRIGPDGKVLGRQGASEVTALGAEAQEREGNNGNRIRREVAKRLADEARISEDAVSGWLTGWTPGRDIEYAGDGVGKLIPGGAYLGFGIHYQAIGTPTTDLSKIGFWFPRAPVKNLLLTVGGQDGTTLIEGKELPPGAPLPNIPPYAENWAITRITPITDDVTIYGFGPHMHLRGKDMKFVLVDPSGKERVLLDVPKYDFNWQIVNQFAEPLKVKAGSKLIVYGHYDNSLKNKWNPAPEKEVFWSEQSWDEMFQPFRFYSLDREEKPEGIVLKGTK